MEHTRPNPFQFHDPIQFLSEFIKYKKKSNERFSIRKLSLKSEVSIGYVSNILKRSRKPSVKGLKKILSSLELTKTEESYLLHISQIQTNKNEKSIKALNQAQRFQEYVKTNPNETEMFRYFSQWHNAAIRELADLPDFSADPKWIQQRLLYHVETKKIERSLRFLLKSGFLSKDQDGRITSTQKRIEGNSKVLRIALIRFHNQMFALAKQSMDKTPGTQRTIKNHTFTAPMSKLSEAQAILDAAVEKIASLSYKKSEIDSVFQFSVALFPLTGAILEKK